MNKIFSVFAITGQNSRFTTRMSLGFPIPSSSISKQQYRHLRWKKMTLSPRKQTQIVFCANAGSESIFPGQRVTSRSCIPENGAQERSPRPRGYPRPRIYQSSGNTLDSINVVFRRWARLVPGWVTVLFGRVNHLGAEPGTLTYTPRSLSHPYVVRLEWVPGERWGVNRHIAWYTSPYPWSRSVRWCLAVGLGCGDQRRRTESGSALEALRDGALYKSTFTLFYFTLSAVPTS